MYRLPNREPSARSCQKALATIRGTGSSCLHFFHGFIHLLNTKTICCTKLKIEKFEVKRLSTVFLQ